MTEADWLVCTDPQRMLDWILSEWGTQPGGGSRYRTGIPSRTLSDRKLRLFTCACCRQVWDQLTDPRSQRAIAVAERYADREATQLECTSARDTAHFPGRAVHNLPWIAAWTEGEAARIPAELIAGEYRDCVPGALQAALLRDLFGNPWRPVKVGCSRGRVNCPTHAPTWLRWNDGTVPKIAQALYDDRRFEEMPILADALEDAGCNEEDLLMHCRGRERCPAQRIDHRTPSWADQSWVCETCHGTGWRPLPGPHVRGCWALDLLLGKE